MPAPSHLLYLHGFRSSPRSAKAQRMARWVREHRPGLHWACPQLPPSPAEALHLVRNLVADWPRERMAVMGSSLGGFYATVLAEALGCPAVLLNPAIDPARDLSRHIGEQTAWHDPNEHFFFRPEFVDELLGMQAKLGPPSHPISWGQSLLGTARSNPQVLAIIAKGDEVLDWREMWARYQQCQVLLLEGSDHGLTDFDDQLPSVLNFLHLNP